MGLTIYDLKLSFTWQKIHAHQFTPDAAVKFMQDVDGDWIAHRGIDLMHWHDIVRISNTAGCYVMNFIQPQPTCTKN